MPADPLRDPKYRHYKPKDLAVVRIDGRDHYLGSRRSRPNVGLHCLGSVTVGNQAA